MNEWQAYYINTTRLVTRDLRTSILLNLELRKEHWAWARIFWNSWRMQSESSSRSGHNRGAAVEADAIAEQQLKRMQSGSSSRSGRNLGAVEKDAIGEQQLKRT